MDGIANYAANGNNTSEAKFELKYPVLEIYSHLQATENTVIDCDGRLSIHIEYSAEWPLKATCDTEDKTVKAKQNIQHLGFNHVQAHKMCALMGCKGDKKCCKGGLVIHPEQPHCAESLENSMAHLNKKIHEATLDDIWHSVKVSEYDGCAEAEVGATNSHQEQFSPCGDENFELVDGIVQTQLVGGRLVHEWKDTMLMEDCGSKGSSKALKELWLGD